MGSSRISLPVRCGERGSGRGRRHRGILAALIPISVSPPIPSPSPNALVSFYIISIKFFSALLTPYPLYKSFYFDFNLIKMNIFLKKCLGGSCCSSSIQQQRQQCGCTYGCTAHSSGGQSSSQQHEFVVQQRSDRSPLLSFTEVTNTLLNQHHGNQYFN